VSKPKVLYTVDLANDANHSFTTTTDTQYSIGSAIIIPGQDATRVGVVDLSASSDNVVTIAGLTNGDGGIGTTIKFINTTGATDGWAAEAIVLNQGDGSVAMASATAFPA